MAGATVVTSAREQILQRLRSARATARLPQLEDLSPIDVPRASLDECVTRFAVESAALGVDCHIEASAEDVRRRLASLVHGARVATWASEHLPYTVGEDTRFATSGGDGTLPDGRAGEAIADVGVTGCDAAIAETASLVMFSAPGRSRTVSLLPPTHIALVERGQLCFSMAEVFIRYRERFRDTASCTVITGPSRTADIELTLTLGIHGPGRVIVIIGP